jgi:hypothetical protein
MPSDGAGGSQPWQAVHDAAVEIGAHAYIDPATGNTVQTELALLARGECCGLGCRHCPYGEADAPVGSDT